jgi:hypothetical protein
MSSRSIQIAQLIDELHQVNEELAGAARPLQRLCNIDLQERQRVADRIRAGLKRWEAVNQRIHDASENPLDMVPNASTFRLSPSS